MGKPPTYELDELRSTGLLWLINASVFHPRGLALAFVYDDDGELIGWRLLAADAGEPFMFAATPEIDALFRQAEITMSLAERP